MPKPLLIAFEGIDGVGKTTQCQLLSGWLSKRDIPNITVKEPGATPLGSTLRDLLVNRARGVLSPFTEMLLFEADRSHTYETLILPSLKSGITVIKDRSIFGTLAYQGYAGGVPLEIIKALTDQASQRRRADWSFLLDLPIHDADERLRRRETRVDHFEAATLDQKEKVRQGYLSEAEANRTWCSIIDASGTANEIANLISAKVEQLLGAHHGST
jgi:dTMP kinase